MTECSHKGTARHWNATVDGRTIDDVAWEYRDHVRREANRCRAVSRSTPTAWI